MSDFSDKSLIVYFSLIILFCLGIFLYLLDSWQLIKLGEFLPGLSQDAPLVTDEQNPPDELEWLRLEKEQKRLEEQQIKLAEEKNILEEEKSKIKEREIGLEKKIESFQLEKDAFADSKKEYQNRKKNINDMARRLEAMPPQDAVEIITNWNNSDVLPVFLQMERNAQLEGGDSIVPYLLTLLPRERSALLMNLMLDERAQEEDDKNN